jgi:hypothetical protein
LRGIESGAKYKKEATLVFDDPSEEYPTVFISAGGYTVSEAEPVGDRTGDLIGYSKTLSLTLI